MHFVDARDRFSILATRTNTQRYAFRRGPSLLENLRRCEQICRNMRFVEAGARCSTLGDLSQNMHFVEACARLGTLGGVSKYVKL